MTQTVLALGFFDGVHLGHGGLLRRTREVADRLGLKACALTFDRHPASFLTGKAIPLLNTPREREALMKSLYGLDEVFFLPFEEIHALSWETFAKEYLLGRYEAGHLVCGHDYRFGAGGGGSPALLEEFCRTHGLGFDCIGEISLGGKTVSSTLIRGLLQEGAVEAAARFLGHPHLLSGRVVDGQKIGRTLGIPTANLEVSSDVLLPKKGVYAAKAHVGETAYPAVVNIGSRPTFGGETVTVEPWLLDFAGDIYGQKLCLEFYAYLRPEQKFPTVEALKEEIHRNAQQTRALLPQTGTGTVLKNM